MTDLGFKECLKSIIPCGNLLSYTQWERINCFSSERNSLPRCTFSKLCTIYTSSLEPFLVVERRRWRRWWKGDGVVHMHTTFTNAAFCANTHCTRPPFPQPSSEQAVARHQMADQGLGTPAIYYTCCWSAPFLLWFWM